jgi:hypothetical protein
MECLSITSNIVNSTILNGFEMENIQLIPPEGKKAVSMDKDKYETLKNPFIKCLKIRKAASFKELLVDVTADLQRENISISGVIEWNLFWLLSI